MIHQSIYPSPNIMNSSELQKILSRSHQMLIDGEMCDASDSQTLETINPATGEVLKEFPNATSDDLDRAVQSASRAQPDWSGLTLSDRQHYLAQVAEVLRKHSAELGALDSLENGNVYSHMQHDAEGGAFMLDYFCSIANEMKGESTQLDNNLHYTRFEPYGVVARLLPFNHPIQSLGAGIGTPLLTGNTVIVKPSPHTSLSTLRFGELIKDVLPKGVINVVTGSNDRVAEKILSHPGIPRLAVTGSTEVGKLALRLGAEHLKTTTLELGGKTPMIVFEDADLGKCVDTAVRGMNFKWQGHSCSSTSRVLIHESLHAEFVEGLAERFRQVNLAMPFDPEAEMGPISHEAQMHKVAGYIESGKAEGATLVCGGERVTEGELSQGFFISPAIFSGVTASMRIAKEEIYGPVISIIPWREEEEAIAIANGVDYGLAAVIMGQDISRVHRTAQKLQCGYVEVNGPVSFALGSPFGGVKSSGVGREGNMQELLSYTQIKSVNIQL
ncbi:MAG: betaine-aldehyde dehydrogenase [Gammaproteobacteria bacterium]